MTLENVLIKILYKMELHIMNMIPMEIKFMKKVI